jgi:homoserine O-succinyltransferase
MLTIGLINNMPTAAIRSAERQYHEILTEAAANTPLILRWFRVSGARPPHYESMDDLWDSKVDGLIVTGAEPKAARLSDEPFWLPLTQTIDWAARNTRSTIWSCLAAHAAVLYLDGVERQPREQKLFGVFDSIKITDHPLFADAEPIWRVPHSRWNDLPEAKLDACGYTVLAKSPDAGVDTFVKVFKESLFIFLQSHPEYDIGALKREYHRDVSRYHHGQQDSHPNVPANYFDGKTAAELEALHIDPAGIAKGLELVEHAELPEGWRHVAVQLYRNWFRYLDLVSV